MAIDEGSAQFNRSHRPTDCHLPEAALPEAELVVRLVSGDALAWNQFIQSFGRLIRSRVADVARSFGVSDESAIDDGTADLFAALVANDCAAMRAFAGRSTLATYLSVIATRVATRKFVRQRSRTRLQSGDDQALDQLVSTRVADPSDAAAQAELREQILQVMAELPLKQREVLRLFHLEGLSYASISETLDMPLGSVGVTLLRAEAKLRERLVADENRAGSSDMKLRGSDL